MDKKYTVNAIGDACPIPVVKTKNAIKEMGEAGGIVETLVDNEIAVQNLTKMANQKGYRVSSEKVNDSEFHVTMEIAGSPAAETEKSEAANTADAENETVCSPDFRDQNSIVVISSRYMGNGDDTLGGILMKGFIYAISQQDILPRTILFYNGGAFLTCEESASLEDLKTLEAEGVEILTCGTC